MSHPFVAEYRDDPPRIGPWVAMDPPPTPGICPTCRPIHDRHIAAERRIQHALADSDERQRREIHALEHRLWELSDEVRRLTREKGDAA